MKTFILEWNPATANYKDDEFLEDIRFLEFGDFSWSIGEHSSARSGDNFYLIRCGDASAGIVMKGFFTSNPYRGKDGDKGQKNFLINLRPTFMVAPHHPRGLLPTSVLEEAMPGFEWNCGYSGRKVPNTYQRILDHLWDDYESTFCLSDLDGVMADRSARPNAGIDEAVALASEVLFDIKDREGNPAILQSLAAGLAGKTDEERVCGFLLPIIHYTDWTAGELRNRGISERILDSLARYSPFQSHRAP